MNTLSPNMQLLIVTFVVFVIIVVTRFLPFWIKGFFERSVLARNVGVLLPGVIMLLLVFHSLEKVAFMQPPYGIPEMGTLLFAIALYLWRNSLLIAFVPSTLVYLIIVNQWYPAGLF